MVSQNDQVKNNVTFPWNGFTGKGIGPKILFGSKEEQQQAMNDFGKLRCIYSVQFKCFVSSSKFIIKSAINTHKSDRLCM